jgi:hypothetical protein
MKRQLVLIDTDHVDHDHWRLDDHTRELGRRGVAQARQALRRAARGTGEPSAA